LYPLDLSKPLHLFVAANSYSVSGALTQIDDNGKHLPVAFVSTNLTETQRMWSVIEREALSVIVFLRKYRQWVLGAVVYIYSDHPTEPSDIKPTVANVTSAAVQLNKQDVPAARVDFYGHTTSAAAASVRTRRAARARCCSTSINATASRLNVG